jgi:L-serine dehydratase
MLSVRAIYKIGKGPSSSHSMAPANAARHFLKTLSAVPSRITVVLYGSLAATGKGHLTDRAIRDAMTSVPVEFEWQPKTTNAVHPNCMDFIGYGSDGTVIGTHRYYSIGGGQLKDDEGLIVEGKSITYDNQSFAEILAFCRSKQCGLWSYLETFDESDIWSCLEQVWEAMRSSVEGGLKQSGELPGGLKLKRRANAMLECANRRVGSLRDRILLSAYALAVAEENAAGGTIVTAPTCGSAGVLPAILYFFWRHHDADLHRLTRALGIAGLIGATVAQRASLSGAQVGCQGEIGAACAMAAGAAAFLLNGGNGQIEYAAEMGLEHFLGLTCDPINGLVQIPCIERNAFAAMRAMDCAAYALATGGEHLVSLDDVIDVMNKTGKDLQAKYRETARGGLAAIMKKKLPAR